MEQCYEQAEQFHKHNKETNKKYPRIEKNVANQLKDLLYVRRKFIESFSKPTKKTKGDLYTYIYAHQMSEHFYDQYLYRILVGSLKEEFSPKFWRDNNLEQYVTGGIHSDLFQLFNDTKEELSVGRIDFDFEKPRKVINDTVKEYDSQRRLENKMNIIKNLGNVIKDHPNMEFLMIHSPYQSSINDLIDNIKVSLDYEKSKQFIKRRTRR